MIDINKKKQEIEKELNDKDISLNKLNTLNNRYEQEIRELKEKLNDKDISLNEYKKELNILDNRHKQEIQELKKELKESKEYINSDTKDKNKVLKKFDELNRLNNEYIKEKKIEQELDEKEQKLNEKEQILQNNTTEINDLKLQNKLLKERLDLKKNLVN